MVRRLGICLCMAALVGFAVAPAFAAVQNVKVSGDIKAMGASRNNFDLKQVNGGNAATTENDKLAAGATFARVKVDADLTDNVSTTIRLLNERLWGADAANQTNGDSGVDVDLANVTMKEFLYSPLTLTVGRQELRYGNALIIGDPDSNITSYSALGTQTIAGANLRDLSLRKSFDSVKAILDYNPLVVDMFFARPTNDVVSRNGKTDIYGLNLRYDTGIKNTIVEGYYFGRIKGSNSAALNTNAAFANLKKPDSIHTIGARVSSIPIENLNLQGELAYQFGNYNPKYDVNATSGVSQPFASGTAQTGRRGAWATQVVADYKIKTKFDPRIAGSYTYFSGEKNNRISGTYHAWGAPYEDQTMGDIINAIFAPSNAHVFTVTAQAKPMSDLTMDLTYVYLRLAKKLNTGGNYNAANSTDLEQVNLSGIPGATTYLMNPKKKTLGHELDLHVAYDYTEDVQLYFAGGVFLPGNAFAKTYNRATATQALASVKVSF